jgi:hypothetical protein
MWQRSHGAGLRPAARPQASLHALCMLRWHFRVPAACNGVCRSAERPELMELEAYFRWRGVDVSGAVRTDGRYRGCARSLRNGLPLDCRDACGSCRALARRVLSACLTAFPECLRYLASVALCSTCP